MAKRRIAPRATIKVQLAYLKTHRCGFGPTGGPARGFQQGQEYMLTESEWAVASTYIDHKERKVFKRLDLSEEGGDDE